MSKKIVVVTLDKRLTKEERRSFEKDHPGYRLSLMLRYPYLLGDISVGIAVLGLIISVVAALK